MSKIFEFRVNVSGLGGLELYTPSEVANAVAKHLSDKNGVKIVVNLSNDSRYIKWWSETITSRAIDSKRAWNTCLWCYGIAPSILNAVPEGLTIVLTIEPEEELDHFH